VSSSAAGGIAIAAGVVAVAALVLAGVAWSRLRSIRAAQQALLGRGSSDLIDFAVSLQGRLDETYRRLDEVASGIAQLDRRVDGVVSRVAIVRYDAYEATGGHQSASIALLDASRTGIVLTAIQGRDYARIYVKELESGRTPVALSPEEQEAVDRAMKG
jgi:phage-related minor tail protein